MISSPHTCLWSQDSKTQHNSAWCSLARRLASPSHQPRGQTSSAARHPCRDASPRPLQAIPLNMKQKHLRDFGPFDCRSEHAPPMKTCKMQARPGAVLAATVCLCETAWAPSLGFDGASNNFLSSVCGTTDKADRFCSRNRDGPQILGLPFSKVSDANALR